MSQRPLSYPIPPSTTSGSDLADILDKTEAARNSNESGATRPGYLAAGGIWSKAKAGGVYEVLLYDGTTDIPLVEDTGNVGGLPVFSTTTTYAVGDILAYQSGIYVCNTPHTGAWNAARFDMVSMPVGTADGNVTRWNNTTKQWEIASRITLTTTGRLGIDNPAPDVDLEVGTSTGTGQKVARVSGKYVEFQCRASDSGGFMMTQSAASAGTRWGWAWANSTDRWTLSTKGTAREMMVGGGKVSINYTSLLYTLTVNGQIAATNSGIINISDRRLKKNISTLPDSLDLIRALKPVQFKYKVHDELDYGDGYDLGFIAQDVEKVIENERWAHRVVHEKDDIYRIDASKLLPLVVKALQETLGRVDELEKRLAKIE